MLTGRGPASNRGERTWKGSKRKEFDPSANRLSNRQQRSHWLEFPCPMCPVGRYGYRTADLFTNVNDRQSINIVNHLLNDIITLEPGRLLLEELRAPGCKARNWLQSKVLEIHNADKIHHPNGNVRASTELTSHAQDHFNTIRFPPSTRVPRLAAGRHKRQSPRTDRVSLPAARA